MTAFVILALVVLNLAQYLNNLDLSAELQSRPSRPPDENPPEAAVSFESMRFGVPPEGRENSLHRRTKFPKLS